MIIQSTKVWINEQFQPAQIEIVGHKISKILKYQEQKVDVDYGSQRILPGLFDIHCHGFNGMDSNYATKQGLMHWSKELLKEGVTSFLPTTSTAPLGNIFSSLDMISDLIENGSGGANMVGIHIEGPHINHEFRGAHNPYLIQKPTVDSIKEFQKAARNHIKMICIAPEKDENYETIAYCKENHIQVSIGHTGANYDECIQAQKMGAKNFTHTFNAMKGLLHRDPGAAGAALSLDDMYAELICDGVHVHYAVAKTVARMKGKDRLLLITDAVQIKGLKPGIYDMPGRWVEVKEDGCGRLKDGRLAGSSNKMIHMVRNLITQCKIEEVIAINAATINPATYLNIEDKGLIRENYIADLIVINDDYEVVQTILMGVNQL